MEHHDSPRRIDAVSLPEDILALIFAVGSADSRLVVRRRVGDADLRVAFPVLVSHVCRRWRQAALAQATLWSRLKIYLECSYELPAIAAWLDRSGAAQLDIILAEPYPRPQAMLTVIPPKNLLRGIAQRVAVLCINGCADFCSVMLRHLGNSLPALFDYSVKLEYLCDHSSSTSYMPIVSPRLRRVNFIGGLARQQPAVFDYTRATYLEVHPHTLHSRVKGSSFFQWLAPFQSLRELRLEDLHFTDAFSSHLMPIVLAQLDTLVLTYPAQSGTPQWLQLLRLPSLQHLGLGLLSPTQWSVFDTPEIGPETDDLIALIRSYSTLRSLQLAFRDPESNFGHEALNALSALKSPTMVPHLNHLSINWIPYSTQDARWLPSQRRFAHHLVMDLELVVHGRAAGPRLNSIQLSPPFAVEGAGDILDKEYNYADAFYRRAVYLPSVLLVDR